MSEQPSRRTRAHIQLVMLVVVAFVAMVLVSFVYLRDVVRAQMNRLSMSQLEMLKAALADDLPGSEAAFLRAARMIDGGYGVMLGADHVILAHREPGLIGQAMRGASPEYARLSEMIAGGGEIAGVRLTDLDGARSIAYFTPFSGGQIGVIAQVRRYYGPVYELMAVFSALGLILMTALNVILLRARRRMRRADEESKSKSSFLARMSHEMRTPMNAIIGMTGIAQKSDDLEKIKESLKKVHDASTHLLGIINDVLDMSKIEAGRLELAPTDFLFSSLIDQVRTIVEHKIEQRGQRFTISVAPDVPAAIVTDKQRLAQVIANLIGNANKFTGDGGDIALTVSRAGGDASSCALTFRVRDNGIGISPEQRKKLFHSFEQADGSISRKFGGTGLGLAISQRIIRRMGGVIEVESELGRGATFSFTVRVGIGAMEAAPVAREAVELPRLDHLTVLLAEDVEINRDVLLATLEDTRIRIDCAENGREAVERFKAAPDQYALIFMDIHMPVMDGFEATRAIRALTLPRAKSIPIIAMTANVFREDIEKCLEAGMNDHTGKPIDLRDILRKIERYAQP